MKKNLKLLGIAAFMVVVILTLTFIISTSRFNLGLPFGYYGDYNVAKNIIKRSACIDSVTDDIVHTDLTLENFSFNIKTKSGRKLKLGFVYEMNVRQVCEHPKGILVYIPGKGKQVYSMAQLSNLLKDKTFTVENTNDVFCHIEELIPIFQANNDILNSTYISEIGGEYLEYLSLDWDTQEMK